MHISCKNDKNPLCVRTQSLPLHCEKREQAAPQHKNKFFCIRFALSLHRQKKKNTVERQKKIVKD